MESLHNLEDHLTRRFLENYDENPQVDKHVLAENIINDLGSYITEEEVSAIEEEIEEYYPEIYKDMWHYSKDILELLIDNLENEFYENQSAPPLTAKTVMGSEPTITTDPSMDL